MNVITIDRDYIIGEQFPIWCQDPNFLFSDPALQQIEREAPEQAERMAESF